MSAPVDISVVVPIYNEEGSLILLHREIARVLDELGLSWEVIYVDDCSRDASLAVLLSLRRQDEHVHIVKFRRNFGQTAALSAGFEVSRGEVVVTMDGDLQNDPADIPRLLASIANGHDIVAGWRKERHDGFILRRLPSQIANRLIAVVTGVSIHDTGCTLKAFRRELVKRLGIYAEQHRFLPAMSKGSGARVDEIVVNHRPRRFGTSKYGIGRATRVMLDLLVVKMLAQFTQRPLQFFGLFSLISAVVSMGFLGFSIWETAWFSGQPLHFNEWEGIVVAISMLLFMVTVYFAFLGLLAELAVKASGMHRHGTLDRILNELHG